MSDPKRLILCIDDDPDVLSVLQIVLEAEGYRFAGAGTAEEGLRLCKAVGPDLIIVDLMMEEIDAGTSFVKDVKLLGVAAPVFLMSSVGDNLSATIDYTALGFAGVFQKPVAKQQLLAVIKSKLA
jgi:DNA-binding response OmpR family regulator